MRIRIHIIDFLTLYCIHMQDQMIIFMALATGESVLRCGPLTLHTESAIHVAEQLTGAKFTIRQAQSCHSAQPVLWSRSRTLLPEPDKNASAPGTGTGGTGSCCCVA